MVSDLLSTAGNYLGVQLMLSVVASVLFNRNDVGDNLPPV